MMLDGDDWQHAFVLAFWRMQASCKEFGSQQEGRKKGTSC
jgi:hypothetical protein